jgi:DNA-binding transcriptional LysR family regulator
VRDHQADVGLTFNPLSLDGLETVFTRDYHVGAVMAPQHPLARRKVVTLQDCGVYPLAWPSRGLSLRALLEQALHGAALPAPAAFECNSLRLMATLARLGNCIAFQPKAGIEKELEEGSLIWRPLGGSVPPDRLMIVCRSGHGNRAAAEAFLALLKENLV